MSKLTAALLPALYVLSHATSAYAQNVTEAFNTTATFNTGTTTYEITGGRPEGANLFHSFLEFSPANRSVQFFTNSSVERVIGRVIGSNSSWINGAISSTTDIDLYLINPNGITFGDQASISIGGSFFASTAESIVFPDGREFSATSATGTELLSSRIPSGLQFVSTPAGITLQGNGSLFLDHPNNGSRISATGFCPIPNLCAEKSSLTITGENTLALVGGAINLDGGNLLAPSGGQITVGSVGANSTVQINSDNSLNYDAVSAFQDINLTAQASIDGSGDLGSAIQVQGRNITLQEGSQIASITTGTNKTGKALSVTAAETLTVATTTLTAVRIFTEANNTNSIGGDINIQANQLVTQDGGRIDARIAAQGSRSGDLTVNANGIFIRGESTGNVLSGLFIDHDTTDGQGGVITVNTSTLRMADKGQINASTSSNGNAGNIVINSDAISLATESFIRNSTDVFSGDAGDITIKTKTLQLNSGGQISTSTLASGNAGLLDIEAEEIWLDGVLDQPSSLTANVGAATATGRGGRLTIDTQRLRLTNGAQIATGTFGIGDGSDIEINATESIEISGTGSNAAGKTFFSGINTQADTSATGDSGNLNINTARLDVSQGGAISVGTIGGGSGGNLTINATDSVTVSGNDGQRVSGISARTRTAQNAGNLNITTGTLKISDQGTVTVESLGGTGNAGNLTVNARYIRLNNNASITGSTTSGQGGNLNLRGMHIIMLNDSEIATTAGTAGQPGDGGNITINAATVTGLFNSDIASNSFRGRGGQIVITAQGIFGLEFRLERTAGNDITAISLVDPELNGEVVLNTPDIDPTQALIEIPIVESPEVVERVCTVRPGSDDQTTGQFAVSGTAVPTGPQGVSSSLGTSGVSEIAPFVGDNEPLRATLITAASATPRPTNNPLIAQGWGTNAQGQLVFTAEPTPDPVQGMLIGAVRCG